MDRIREFFELERFELREVIYESCLRKFDGDFEFVRIKERFELRRFEIERVNCSYEQGPHHAFQSRRFFIEQLVH